MNAPPPMLFSWDDDHKVMVPLSAARAAAAFVPGETYRLEVREERSAASHAHYFACIETAWNNLPETMADRFPTPDHLRRWCLIRAGYRDEKTIVVASKAEARNLVSFIRPIDDYAVVVARENTVIFWTAKSQSVKAMGKKEFAASKEAVLRILAELLGTRASVLETQAGRAA